MQILKRNLLHSQINSLNKCEETMYILLTTFKSCTSKQTQCFVPTKMHIFV